MNKCIEAIKCIINAHRLKKKNRKEKKAWVKRGLLYMEAGLGSVTVRDSDDCHQTVGKPKSLSKVLQEESVRWNVK